MTIADRIRQLAQDSSVPGDLYEQFAKIADEIDAKANELVSVGRTHYACELAATLGGKGYSREIMIPDQRPQVWRASVRDDDGKVRHFYGATPEEANAQRSAYIRGANGNTTQQSKTVSSEYLGADRK